MTPKRFTVNDLLAASNWMHSLPHVSTTLHATESMHLLDESATCKNDCCMFLGPLFSMKMSFSKHLHAWFKELSTTSIDVKCVRCCWVWNWNCKVAHFLSCQQSHKLGPTHSPPTLFATPSSSSSAMLCHDMTCTTAASGNNVHSQLNRLHHHSTFFIPLTSVAKFSFQWKRVFWNICTLGSRNCQQPPLMSNVCVAAESETGIAKWLIFFPVSRVTNLVQHTDLQPCLSPHLPVPVQCRAMLCHDMTCTTAASGNNLHSQLNRLHHHLQSYAVLPATGAGCEFEPVLIGSLILLLRPLTVLWSIELLMVVGSRRFFAPCMHSRCLLACLLTTHTIVQNNMPTATQRRDVSLASIWGSKWNEMKGQTHSLGLLS